MVTQLPRTAPRRKHSATEWRFDYNPHRKRWETYRVPIDWPFGLYGWLREVYGPPLSEDDSSEWDYIGGHIYLYSKENLALFLLTWS